MPSHRFTIDISAESLDKTSGLARPGPVNLEKPCAPTTGWAGTSCRAMWTASAPSPSFAQVGESWELRMAPRCAGAYLAYKGSITVNGVSLTVNRVTTAPQGCEISINLIPHTVENTALGALATGSPSTWKST
jgi:riboflavin synthase